MFGMGVADGVYMWREKGIDSGLFSRALAETALHCLTAGDADVMRGALSILILVKPHLQFEFCNTNTNHHTQLSTIDPPSIRSGEDMLKHTLRHFIALTTSCGWRKAVIVAVPSMPHLGLEKQDTCKTAYALQVYRPHDSRW